MKGLFITGTGTNIGKTEIACQIIHYLNKFNNIELSVRKPVETGCNKLPADALLLNQANNNKENLDLVCKYRYKIATSPELASKKKKDNLNLEKLYQACNFLVDKKYVIIEGAGGICSPIAKNTMNIDLIKILKIPILLIVKDELGAVNQAIMAHKICLQENLFCLGIVLNEYKKNNLQNIFFIKKYTKLNVFHYKKDFTKLCNQFNKSKIFKKIISNTTNS